MTHNVKMTHNKDEGYHVSIDGVDVTNMLSSVEMRADPAQPPRFFLEMSAIDVTEIGGDASVVFELPPMLPDAALDQIILRCEQAKEANRIARKAEELKDGQG